MGQCPTDLDLVEEVVLPTAAPEPEPTPEPVGLEPLTLRIGGVYRMRDDRTTGALVEHDSVVFPFRNPDNNTSYMTDGSFYSGSVPCGLDIVAEVELDVVETPPEPFALREGGYYRNRSGDVVGPIIRRTLMGTSYPWTHNGLTYTDGGKFDNSSNGSFEDLVSETDAPIIMPPIPDSVATPQVGEFWRLRNGQAALVRCNRHSSDYPLMCTVFRNGNVFVETYTRRGTVSTNGSVSELDMTELLPDGVDYCAMPELPAGYSEWYSMGSSALVAHLPTQVEPWCTSLGEGQPYAIVTQGFCSHKLYHEMFIALPMRADENDVTSLKRAASIKACGKYSQHLALDTHPLVTEMIEELRLGDEILSACYKNDQEAYVLRFKDGIHTMMTMRYAKVFKLLRPDATDDDVRKFTRRMDRAIKGNPDVVIEWSTVSDTYCTPMEGWCSSRPSNAVTGSCMEKFCEDSHEVFELYDILERGGHLQMLKITIDDDYVGRVICWKRYQSSDEWVMDRVYCRESRGEIPPVVFTALLEFAQANRITKRTHACRTPDMEHISMRNIHVNGLDELSHYPYMDTFEGVSPSGLMVDHCDCTITCKNTDGTGEECEEDNTVEVRGGGYYEQDECTWSSYYDEWVRDEDVQEDYLGRVLHRDDVVALGEDEDMYAHEDDVISVKLPNGRGGFTSFYALED
jgi:hypothetical protein